jgi:hypothetical protein
VDKAGLDKFRGTGRSRLEIDWLLFAQDDFVTDSRPPDAAPKSREWPARARKMEIWAQEKRTSGIWGFPQAQDYYLQRRIGRIILGNSKA